MVENVGVAVGNLAIYSRHRADPATVCFPAVFSTSGGNASTYSDGNSTIVSAVHLNIGNDTNIN